MRPSVPENVVETNKINGTDKRGWTDTLWRIVAGLMLAVFVGVALGMVMVFLKQ